MLYWRHSACYVYFLYFVLFSKLAFQKGFYNTTVFCIITVIIISARTINFTETSRKQSDSGILFRDVYIKIFLEEKSLSKDLLKRDKDGNSK